MNSDGSFNNESPETSRVTVNNHRSNGPIIALALGLLAVAGFSFYQLSQVSSLRQQLSASQDKESADVQSQLAAQNAALTGTVNDLQAKLADTEQQTSQSIAKVQDTAKRHADAAASSVAKSLEKKNDEQQEALNAELAGVKNAQSDAASKIDGVGASVDSVKTDLASTKTVVDQTAAELQRTSGDMGVMSGLIATNGKEIAELRARGDRNIYEFTITKKNGMMKIGDVQMRLTKVDPKHNRYTMVVMADDKMIEKRDKTTNEPVQFYAAPGARTPYEVVVNEVGKDEIKGYLATPKVSTARN
jgi:chromosome segregation ATPase